MWPPRQRLQLEGLERRQRAGSRGGGAAAAAVDPLPKCDAAMVLRLLGLWGRRCQAPGMDAGIAVTGEEALTAAFKSAFSVIHKERQQGEMKGGLWMHVACVRHAI